ncbi:uncharacterized protein A4U43_C03F28480 [Asparagus officinalis]|uniref:Uncharacterized protein n=1 Tax=Asparagus officinalis TaxID=4686 RepID=A0A5P1FDN8_ASPOF|nr:uncharacterized protein A4U43_C03F28480 [Asparagus officinalis]
MVCVRRGLEAADGERLKKSGEAGLGRQLRLAEGRGGRAGCRSSTVGSQGSGARVVSVERDGGGRWWWRLGMCVGSSGVRRRERGAGGGQDSDGGGCRDAGRRRWLEMAVGDRR